MKPFKLATSLILVPRLFLTLVFLPLVFSLILVSLQLFISSGMVTLLSRNSVSMEKKFSEGRNYNLIRKILYGDASRLPELRVCRWDGSTTPSGECTPHKFDVAIQTESISDEEIKKYVDIFQGNIKRLHICKDCTPDIVIIHQGKEAFTKIYSVWGLMLASLVSTNQEVTEQYVSAVKKSENIMNLMGTQIFYFGGYDEYVSLNELGPNVIFILNISGMLMIAVWLALKAHKKILDYFSKSGALLPLVAATGKKTFYQAMWIITAIRVSAFLLTALPITIYSIVDMFSYKSKVEFLDNDPIVITFWGITIILALSFAALIASVSDLKQRYSIWGVLYKFLPMTLCLFGALVWSLSFLTDGVIVDATRLIITSLPVIGLAPVIVSPIIKPSLMALLIHSVLTAGLFRILLHRNSDWFAAHLEDL